MTRSRILLADDYMLQTDGLTNILGKHFDITGVARDGRELIQQTMTQLPDVVIVDVDMPVLNGIAAARTIHTEASRSKLLFLTLYDEVSVVQEAFRAGALGYVHKSCPVSELINAIRCVARGTRYVSQTIPVDLLPPIEGLARRHRQEVLTPRRRQILEMIAQGLTMKEIGVRLGIATRTVEKHKYLLMRTLGVSTTASLIRYAIRTNVV